MADAVGTVLPDWMRNWPIWAVLLLAIGLPAFRTASELGKWIAGFVSGREDARVKTMATAQQQFEVARVSLMAELQDQVTKARSTLDSYEADLAKLRRARSSLIDAMAELRGAAVAARAMVHELERRLGDPATVFKPLPSTDEDTPMRS